jgi:MSHA biogenesis protein MshM
MSSVSNLGSTLYEAHFGFRQPPFALTPDTRFFFAQASHQDALNTLLVALRSGEGFLKVTGEIGLGKTQLCRQLLNSLGPGFVTAYIPNPAISPAALFRTVAEELGCAAAAEAAPEQLLKRISQQLLANAAKGVRTVLVVDEAQALSDETLEAIRLLTNLETETYKLLQVVLFGQPELDARLARRSLRQLRQRISFSHRLAPLDADDLRAYVRHRLEVAGARNPALFSDAALRVVYRASRGIPRLVNILCHKALLAAFGPGRAGVDRPDAIAAVDDTELPAASKLRLFAAENAGALAFALAVAGVAIYVLGPGGLALLQRVF